MSLESFEILSSVIHDKVYTNGPSPNDSFFFQFWPRQGDIVEFKFISDGWEGENWIEISVLARFLIEELKIEKSKKSHEDLYLFLADNFNDALSVARDENLKETFKAWKLAMRKNIK